MAESRGFPKLNYEKFKNTEVGKSLGQCTKVVFSDNFLQSKFGKVEKFSETGRNQKTLICFSVIFDQ